MPVPFRIKICGLTNAADAQQAVACGADALGYNFYQRSLRHVTVDEARRIRRELPDSLCHVGVFVNCTADEILATLERCQLNAVQLHGDETPAFAQQLAPWPVIRAIRHPVGGALASLWSTIEAWEVAGACAVLLDAMPGGNTYGGSGTPTDWPAAAEVCRTCRTPVILAGGLTADNVGQAIQEVRPAAVDVASGVEVFAGKKNPVLLRAFIEASRQAFAAISADT